MHRRRINAQVFSVANDGTTVPVIDVEGFYCAIGEAINGPGGYFGWNADALHDCLRGEWGARTPFTLVWHDSVVARERLRREAQAVAGRRAFTFEQITQWLTEDGSRSNCDSPQL